MKTADLFTAALTGGGNSGTAAPSATDSSSSATPSTDSDGTSIDLEIPNGEDGEETSSMESKSDPSSEDSSLEVSQDEDVSGKKPSSSPEIEYISVTDHTGRKVKVKVDYKDKDSIKHAFNLAAGARKWQAERDSLRSELESFRGQAGKKVENWDTVSGIYKDQGVKGLINFLEGREDAFDSLIDQANQEREWRATASPEQIALRDAQRAQQLKDREIERIKQELEAIKQSQTSAQEQQEIAQVRSQINPSFDKYRFAGRLNNPRQEQMFDEMLWNNALKQLESLPDDYDITPEVINKVFRDYSTEIRTLINTQADKKVNQVVAEKKRTATEQAQLKATKDTQQKQNSNSLNEAIKSGRTADIFRAAASKSKNFFR